MKAAAATWAVAAACALMTLLLSSDAAGRLRLAEANGMACAALAADADRLAAYSSAEATLLSLHQAGGGKAAEVPLPVSLPLPDSTAATHSTSSGMWEVSEFELGWERLPSKTALEALSALCGLGAPWRMAGFRLAALDDGESCSLDAKAVSVAPVGKQ